MVELIHAITWMKLNGTMLKGANLKGYIICHCIYVTFSKCPNDNYGEHFSRCQVTGDL